MLPKVATQILHHTSRAAAAVQTQTTQTIRNALSTSSTSASANSPWSTTGSSHWGNNGTGPGGSKYGGTGNRFYYGAGRAVTQANIISSQDGIIGQNEEEESALRPATIRMKRAPATRSRSYSLSAVTPDHPEPKEDLGVLKTVQLHYARSRQILGQPSLKPEHPVLVRRNSTSVSASFDAQPVTPPPSPTKSIRPSSPAHLQPSGPYLLIQKALADAKATKDHGIVAAAVRQFRATVQHPTVKEFNLCLHALHQMRRPGEPLTLLLETYNDMLSRSLLPNLRTYLTLIFAITDRDFEVQKITAQLDARAKSHTFGGMYATGPTEAIDPATDAARADQLRSENNFGSAMALFEAILAINANTSIPPAVYVNLLRSCAHHANVEAAIHIYAQIEQRQDIRPTSAIFSLMMSTYMNAGDLGGAKAIFAEFHAASKQGKLGWLGDESESHDPEVESNAGLNRTAIARKSQLLVWNKMIEAYFRAGQPAEAITILEQMMDSKAGANYGPADVPPPASSTYTTIITGFITSDDVPSALSWFDNLLIQTVVAPNPFAPMSHPPRPDQVAWITMLDGLASANMIVDLNRLFEILVRTASEDGLTVRPVDRLLLYRANMKHLSQPEVTSAKALPILDFLSEHILTSGIYELKLTHIHMELAEQYIRFGAVDSAISLMEALAQSERKRLGKVKVENIEHGRYDSQVHQGARRAITSLVQVAFEQNQQNLPFEQALRLIRLLDDFGIRPPRIYSPYLLHAYGLAKRDNSLPALTPADWELLGFAAATVESPARADDDGVPPTIQNFAFSGTMALLQDMSQAGLDVRAINLETLRNMVSAVTSQYDTTALEAHLTALGPTYQEVIGTSRRDLETLSDVLTRQSESGDSMSDVSEFTVPTPSENAKIDMYLNRSVDEFYYSGSLVDVNVAFERFLAGARESKYPTPQTIGHLITSLGRAGATDKVRYLYTAAQAVLQSSDNQTWQTKSWFTIEDAMVIALAHAGDLAGAHVHRVRILEQGSAPSADAYGALIQYVKDTTDDTSSAVALFEESQMHGVAPNIYLYNNIISKLAKARKADYALELFQRMKSSGLIPSSITYGALIAACARVADHNSAEILFSEMTQQKNFRPRIPPYNTMMQLYTSTKPNRERVLYYYNSLRRAGVAPTAHTYKLLIDAYGTIEPLDLSSVQTVFQTLEKDPKVQVQGTHWAALINAWGCAKKDLAKATQIFDSIQTHPDTLKSRTPLPDAVCYEAMINVLVSHRQANLMPTYIERLHQSGVHMTAYIANFIIKGYANMGDLIKAREMFESMVDPAQGMAAPNNHIPHDGGAAVSSSTAQVFREPSTWEVMVRAELGVGNRQEAVQLLERLKARNYPEAVYNRISGIMLNDPVSPWSNTPPS